MKAHDKFIQGRIVEMRKKTEETGTPRDKYEALYNEIETKLDTFEEWENKAKVHEKDVNPNRKSKVDKKKEKKVDDPP